MDGQLPQDGFATWRHLHDDGASVGLGTAAPNQAAVDESVDQLDGGVVSDLQALGQHADRRHPRALDALHLEQEQVLLRLEPRGPGQLFADPQEAAHLIAQIGQRLVVHPPGGRGARADASRHRSTVSRRDSWTITV